MIRTDPGSRSLGSDPGIRFRDPWTCLVLGFQGLATIKKFLVLGFQGLAAYPNLEVLGFQGLAAYHNFRSWVSRVARQKGRARSKIHQGSRPWTQGTQVLGSFWDLGTSLDASSSMVIVNWTLWITFGIFKLFGQYSFVAKRYKIHSLWPRRSRGFKL